MHLILPRLRNIPILAKEAPHVAASRPHAEHTSPRQKMIQRFFFNRINLQSSGRPIAEAIKFSALIDADKTKSRLSRMDVAMTRAKVAMNAAARFRLPPPRFVQLLSLLEDLQFAQGSILLPCTLYACGRGESLLSVVAQFPVSRL
jgi:hypothetical protein